MNHVGPMPNQIEGRAYARLSSRMEPATLMHRAALSSESNESGALFLDVLNAEGVVITGALLSDVAVDAPLARQPRRMTFPDGTLFETDDQEAIKGLVGQDRWGLLHQLEEFHPRLIAFVIACLAGVWIIYRYGLDILVAGAIWLTPPVLVDQIDRGTLQAIDFQMADASLLGAEDKAKVEDVFAALLPHVEQVPDGTEFRLLFRSMPGIGSNAFALPGGTVVMTDAFVREFPEEDVLAGVLGHEIGHVVERHGLRQVYRSLTIYILIALMAGDTGPILEDILLEGNLLLSLSYSRAHENSADEFGVELSDAAGFDPRGLTLFFERMGGKAEEPPQWLSTHPNSADRVKTINGFIQNLDR